METHPRGICWRSEPTPALSSSEAEDSRYAMIKKHSRCFRNAAAEAFSQALVVNLRKNSSPQKRAPLEHAIWSEMITTSSTMMLRHWLMPFRRVSARAPLMFAHYVLPRREKHVCVPRARFSCVILTVLRCFEGFGFKEVRGADLRTFRIVLSTTIELFSWHEIYIGKVGLFWTRDGRVW